MDKGEGLDGQGIVLIDHLTFIRQQPVVVDIIFGHEAAVPELRGQYFIEAVMAVQVELTGAVLQLHGKDQAHKAQVVVAMQMTYKNMIDAMEVELVPHHLHLGSFSAIDHETPVLNFQQLCAGIPAESGDGPAGSEDG